MLHKMWSYKNEVGSSIPVLINTFTIRIVQTNMIFEIVHGMVLNHFPYNIHLNLKIKRFLFIFALYILIV